MIRRLIRSLAAFPRFVLHDLRLSARALASMFGSLSLRRLAALIALLFVALHIAAYPVAGWLIAIEDGPDGVMRITAILASGAALVFPWIVGQSIADFTRTLFGRSDLELILASPVDAHALLAARALSISVGAVASVGLLLAPLADVAALRGHPHWLALYPALIAAGLAGTGFAIILSMGLFLATGPRRARLFGQIAATAVGASAVLGAQVVAMLPEGMRTTILAAFAPPANAAWRAARPPVGAGARGGGRPASDSRLDSVRRRRLCARLRAVRRALRARGDRHCGRAGSRRRRSEGDVALWRERQHGLAHQGAARRLARSLADVATSSAGRLHDAARRDSLARRRPDGHGRGRLHAGLGGDRRATRRRALLDRALGRGRAGFSHDRSPAARRHRTRQDRRHRPADRAHSRACPLPHWPSLRPGLGFARFCSAPERSPRPRWSISGAKRHRVVASCCVVTHSRSSSA